MRVIRSLPLRLALRLVGLTRIFRSLPTRPPHFLWINPNHCSIILRQEKYYAHSSGRIVSSNSTALVAVPICGILGLDWHPCAARVGVYNQLSDRHKTCSLERVLACGYRKREIRMLLALRAFASSPFYVYLVYESLTGFNCRWPLHVVTIAPSNILPRIMPPTYLTQRTQ